MARILVVEDEESYREPLAFSLKRDGYDVVVAEDGNKAIDLFSEDIDVILLDLMLPGMNGIEVCRTVRKTSDVPVIMLTAKDSEIDKVVGLEIGADDYITKPYSYRELLARITAVLRRSEMSGGPIAHEEILEVGRVRMSVDRHEVEVDGELINMPLREYELLEFFMRNPDRVLTRSQLLDRIWGEGYVGDTKTLDVHVKRIRGRIEEDPANPIMIRTVRGLGYKMVDA